jgi:hypothetical protein
MGILIFIGRFTYLSLKPVARVVTAAGCSYFKAIAAAMQPRPVEKTVFH